MSYFRAQDQIIQSNRLTKTEIEHKNRPRTPTVRIRAECTLAVTSELISGPFSASLNYDLRS